MLSYFSMPEFIKGGPLCKVVKRLDNQVAIITGSNTGIGKEMAGELARRGCKVYLASRNMERLNEAKKDLLTMYNQQNYLATNLNAECLKTCYSPVTDDKIIPAVVDLSDFKSICDFVDSLKEEKVDILVCNAGIAGLKQLTKNEDNFEVQFATNHLGHLLLTELLYDKLKASDKPRIAFVSAWGHKYGNTNWEKLERDESDYTQIGPYTDSKLGNVIYARYLSEKFRKAIVSSHHPGVVKTEIFRNVSGLTKYSFMALNMFGVKPWEGCQTSLHCILSDDIVSGGFYMQSRQREPLDIVNNPSSNETMIRKSIELMKRSKYASLFTGRLQKYLTETSGGSIAGQDIKLD